MGGSAFRIYDVGAQFHDHEGFGLFCSVHLPTVVKASEDLSYLDAYPTVQTVSSPRACACGCGQASSLFSGIRSSVFVSNRGVIRIVGSLPACIVEALIMIASMTCWDSPGTGTIHSGVTRRRLQHPSSRFSRSLQFPANHFRTSDQGVAR